MNRPFKRVYVAALLAFASAGAAVAASATSATNAREGIANARMHASVAAKVDTLDGVHLHLHHVVNCLEGSHGAQYSAKAEALSEYHCNSLSEGVVDDPQAGPHVRRLARKAVQEALAGIHTDNLVAGHRDAAGVVKALAATQGAWPKKR